MPVYKVVSTMDPDITNITERFSDVIDMSVYSHFLCCLMTSYFANNQNLHLYFYHCDKDGENRRLWYDFEPITEEAGSNSQYYFKFKAKGVNPKERYGVFGIHTDDAQGGAIAFLVWGYCHYSSGPDLDTAQNLWDLIEATA